MWGNLILAHKACSLKYWLVAVSIDPRWSSIKWFGSLDLSHDFRHNIFVFHPNTKAILKLFAGAWGRPRPSGLCHYPEYLGCSWFRKYLFNKWMSEKIKFKYSSSISKCVWGGGGRDRARENTLSPPFWHEKLFWSQRFYEISAFLRSYWVDHFKW